MIKLLTCQHNNVLATLQAGKCYVADRKGKNAKSAPVTYQRISEKLSEKTGITIKIPIFAWANLPGHDLNYSEEIIELTEGMIGPREDSVYLELLVPDKLCLHTRFYYFTDAIFYEMESDPEERDECLRLSYIDEIDIKDEVQTVIPYIDPSFIQKIYKH